MVLLPVLLRAQAIAPAQFRFEHLTVDQGLSHSDAMAVAQDQAGFIWVGTNHGIDRYDGYKLKAYLLPVNSQGISANRIRVLHAAPAGRLWAGVEGNGLSFYEAATDQFRMLGERPAPANYQTLLSQLAATTVTALATDVKGRLWVGTHKLGLLVLTFDSQGNPLTIRQVSSPTGEAHVSCLASDPEGTIWVGTLNKGLYRVRTTSPALTFEATAVQETIRALLVDRRGDLWIAADNQVLWVSAVNRRTGQQLLAHPQPITYPLLQSLLLDSFGRLWVGTMYGLYVWEAGPLTGQAPPLRGSPMLLLPEAGMPASINSERVHQLFEDRTQVMWLCASAGGLDKVNLRQKPFGLLRQQSQGPATLPNNYINAVYKEEATHTLWLGTRNGVAAYDMVQHTYRVYLNQIGSDIIMRGVDVAAILRTSNGTLWFGTRNRGLISLRRTNGREILTLHGQLSEKESERVSAIEHLAEDRYGNLWVATFSRGLAQFNLQGELQRVYRTAEGPLPTDRFTYLLYDPGRDVLWASTANAGLLKLQTGPQSLRVIKQFTYAPGQKQGLGVNYVWPLVLSQAGTLWVGTIGGGLYELVTDAQGRETLRSHARELPMSDVESMLLDNAGHLWLGGTGLYRFTPATRQYLRYDASDGLQSTAFKIGAADRGADGTLYFGGTNGVSYFQPAAIQPNPYAPVVQVTGLRIANQPVDVGQPFEGRVVLAHPLSQPQTVVIQPEQNDFSVDFVGLNYPNPQKTRYAYQLVGFNAHWVYPTDDQRTASFTNLPPGHYALRLRASNGEGVWSAPVAALQFEVQAPWYKTSWAYAFYACLLVGAIVLYRRVEMTQQQLKNTLALEQFQAEKEKELTNLKLGFFTNISHELRTPLTLILGPLDEIVRRPGSVLDLRGKAEMMQRQAQKLLNLVTQLLDFQKVESGHVPLRARPADVVPWLEQQYAAFVLQAQQTGIDYRHHLPPAPLLLYFDASKLEIILTNLLANAFKYTRAEGRVELAATVVGLASGQALYSANGLVDNYLKVIVSDTGSGIAKHELGRIFDPYYQAAHTNTLRMTGTGIGLALARQFAVRHGGQLTVTSTQGVGSSFELRLPLGQQHLLPEDLLPEDEATEQVPDLEPEAEPQPETGALASGSRPRLLVVEDDEDVREYLHQLFEEEYDVTTAGDGLEGWEQALAQTPDLILSDVMMPRSDGLELCQRLKLHPKTNHIPVILLTARTAEIHQLEGLGVGADDYVSKPFTPILLRAKAAALLLNRRRLHEFYQRCILLEPNEIVVADAERLFLEKAMAVVEQNLGNPALDVQLLVKEMAMSQSACYRRIKSITGQTAVEFIRDVRMKRAAQLLTTSQMRVSEVSFEVGLEDTRYFSKMFQKQYGQTPSEYARQHRPGKGETKG